MPKGNNFSHVLIEPVITEKSTALSQFGKYTFKISSNATKDQVKEAFKKVYPDLKVVSVNISTVRGKAKRTKSGVRAPKDSKKAIVSVEGGKIDYFPETA